MLTTLPLALEWLRDRPVPAWLAASRTGRAVLVLGAVGGLAAAAFGAGDIRSTFRAPGDPALIEAVGRLPKDAVVGGFVKDLDFSPALTGRSTLFNRELAVAYQSGYFKPIAGRMRSMRTLVETSDPSAFAANLSVLAADVLLVEDETLDTGLVPVHFRGFFGGGGEKLPDTAAPRRQTLLKTIAAACVLTRYRTVSFIDAHCLGDRLRARTPG